MVLMLAQPASATVTSSISDVQGDANRWINKNKEIPSYLDIKSATLNLETGMFTLTMEMWGQIPDEPVLFNGIHSLFWQWTIDVEGGPYPYSHRIAMYEEYTVCVIWDGDTWCAQLWDCTDMVEPGEFLILDIQTFECLDCGFTVTVPSSWLDDVQGGMWMVGDNGFKSPLSVSDAYAWWFFDIAGYDMSTGEGTPWGV